MIVPPPQPLPGHQTERARALCFLRLCLVSSCKLWSPVPRTLVGVLGDKERVCAFISMCSLSICVSVHRVIKMCQDKQWMLIKLIIYSWTISAKLDVY